jgi:plastocyanin
MSASAGRCRPVLAVLLLAAAVALAACAGLPPTPGPGKVVIADLKFNPRTITVNKGDTVTWTNEDQTAHTVTSDDYPTPDSTATPPPGSFTSKILNPGESFTHTFEQPGKVTYHCQLHQYLTGEVVVK